MKNLTSPRKFLFLICLVMGMLATSCGDDSMDSGSMAYGEEEWNHGSSSSSGASYSQDMSSSSSSSSGGFVDEEQPSNEGDRYEAVGTNPFVMTAHDPFSTFAADVDTASYDIFRRDVDSGQLPQPASVRLEEYVNYFEYDYPAPAFEGDAPFGISLDAMPHVFDTGTTILSVGIQGKVVPEGEKKAANLVFLIDVSGSMASSAKLPLVKTVLNETLEILDAEDTVSIVTYAGSTGVQLPPTSVADRETISAAINSFTSGGSTAGASGINLAYEQATAGFIEGGINHVILCTDGDFNVGASSNTALVELIEEKRESGVTLTTLGFGTGNLNDSMMEAVSNAGNGVYGVITDEDHAIDYVHERMLSTLVHIAKDMKIQVEFNADHVLAYRLLGYENRAIADQDFRDDAVDAGEIGSGHQVTALYELVLSGGAVPIMEDAPEVEDGPDADAAIEVSAEELVLVKVRYKDVGATTEDTAHEVAASLTPEELVQRTGQTSEDARWAVAVAGFAELLKQSPYARSTEMEAIAAILDPYRNSADTDRAEFVRLFDVARVMLEQR